MSSQCDDRRPNVLGARAGQAGFTLLELLVALTLAAIISLCISTVGGQAQKIYDTTTAKVEVYQKFRYALDDMEQTLVGWVPTTSTEFFVDKQQQNQGGGKNGHWDDGEELSISGPNLDGGLYEEFDEGAKIFERKYTLDQGGAQTSHDAYSIYFRGTAEIDGVIKQANIQYLLADPREIREGRSGDMPTEVDNNADFVLLKVIRYLDINGDNYDTSTLEVKEKIVEICPNVTDLKIEYFYDNIFDQKPGAFVIPSIEQELVESEKVPQDRGEEGWMKEFLYGGFRDFIQATAYRGRRSYQESVNVPAYFQVPPGGRDPVRFSQLSVGDPIYIWSEGAGRFPPGNKTIARNENGRLFFQEEIDTTSWESNQTGLRFRAAYVPSAVRVSIRVLNDKGREPRALSVTVHPYRATM